MSVDTRAAELVEGGASGAPGDCGLTSGTRGRVRVEGKSFVLGGRKVRIRGVTYGPFEPGADGQPFPGPGRTAEDFALMHAAGISAIRTYHVPSEWLLELADEHAISVLVDVPWPKHVCFLESEVASSDARRLVHQAAMRGRGHTSLLAYSIGNEIRPTSSAGMACVGWSASSAN